MVTIKDIAKVAGVTYATVSRALNGQPGVNPLTRQKIIDISKEMNYVPNLAAKRLADKNSKTIGFYWPLKSLFFWRLCNELHIEANKRGFSILASFGEPEQALRLFNEHFIDRVLFWTGDGWVPSMEFYKARELIRNKILLIGGGTMEGAHQIAIERKEGIFNAVKKLAELGHRRIVFLGAETDKMVGFTLGLLEFELEYTSDSIITYDGRGPFPDEKLSSLFSSKQTNKPTAIIVDSQGALFDFLTIIRQCKFRIPDDFSLIVYDSIPEMEQIIEIPITTVGPDIHELAVKALDILADDQLIKEDAPSIQMSVKPKLTIRESIKEIE